MKKKVIILFYPSPWPEEQRGRIPYALLYLERMVRDLGVEVILIDEQVQRNYLHIIEEVRDNLLIAGVSAMTGNQIKGGIKFSKIIKSRTNALVLWGGWHITLLPEQTLKEKYIDMAIMGQGEHPFRKLTLALLEHKSISGIKGIAYKKNNKIIVNPPDTLKDINEFPKLDYSLININNYVFKNSYAERCVGYFSSHGCPYNCAFCCISKVYNRRWYPKKIETIIEDMKYFKKVAKIDSVIFDDDNFFVNKNFVLELCNNMIKSNLNLKWDTSAHAGLFTKIFSDKDIALFYKAGCRQIYVGAESGDQKILDLIDKHSTVDDNLKFVRILNSHKIIPQFSTMVCFPINPYEDLKKTFEMIRRAKIMDNTLKTRIFFYTPYPGTELYKKAIEKGFKPPERLEGWVTHTLRKFHAPWWTKDYRKELEIFANFYVPLANPKFYELAPKKVRWIVFLINKLFYPIVLLRFKTNNFKYPLEAVSFLKILSIFNEIMKTKYSLGFESYFD